MASSVEHLVRNQMLLPEVNDRLAELSGTWGGEPPEFVCECTSTECTETFPIPLAEYEDIRAQPNRFLILPGHENSEVDHVVETYEAFSLVEKTKYVGLVLESYRSARPPEGD